MTTDDKRALLLAFVEWADDNLVECASLEDDESTPRLPEERDVAAFLAQLEPLHNLQQLPVPRKAGRWCEKCQACTRHLEHHTWKCDDCGTAQSTDKFAHVKVTEVVGRMFDGGRTGNYIRVCLDPSQPDAPQCVDIDNAIPDEAKLVGQYGPRGRFRVKVEFWPEPQDNAKAP